MDSNRIPENGRRRSPRIGDLVRIAGVTRSYSVRLTMKELGVVTMTPNETGGILFIEVFLLKRGRTFSFGPQDLEIISNIDS